MPPHPSLSHPGSSLSLPPGLFHHPGPLEALSRPSPWRLSSLGLLCPLNRFQHFTAAEATEDSGGQWESTDGVSCTQGPPSSPSPGGMELWSRAGVGWGHSRPLACWAQVLPGLAGSELSALLRLGLGRGTEEGEGEGGRAPARGGVAQQPLPLPPRRDS